MVPAGEGQLGEPIGVEAPVCRGPSQCEVAAEAYQVVAADPGPDQVVQGLDLAVGPNHQIAEVHRQPTVVRIVGNPGHATESNRAVWRGRSKGHIGSGADPAKIESTVGERVVGRIRPGAILHKVKLGLHGVGHGPEQGNGEPRGHVACEAHGQKVPAGGLAWRGGGDGAGLGQRLTLPGIDTEVFQHRFVVGSQGRRRPDVQRASVDQERRPGVEARTTPWLLDGDLVLRETTRAVEAGFGAVKLHETDPEFSAVLRREFGEELTIMVDVNGHFDPVEAIDHGRRLAELGVLWFEEPVSPMRDHAAIARVGRALAAGDPVCDLAGGENEYTVGDFERLLATGALTYLQPEITKIGGLTAARRIAVLAEAANVALCPHNFRLGPSFSASIHWAFTSPASRWIEVPWVPEAKHFAHPTGIPALVDGAIAAPTGIGFDLSR